MELEDVLRLLAELDDDERVAEILREQQPYDVAELIPDLPAEARLRIMRSLPPAFAAETLEHLTPELQYSILDHLGEDAATAVANELSSDAVADLALSVHPRQAERLLALLPPDYREVVRKLTTYPESSAGGRMTVDYISVRQTWTQDQVMQHIRKVAKDVETINYLYVVDQDGRLTGVTSLRDLILAQPGDRVQDFMSTRLIAVTATADQEEAARELANYDFLAVPVTDPAGRLVGIITWDDVMDVIEEEATEDIQRMGGTEPLGEPYMEVNLFTLYRKRVGWLLLLFLAQSFTGTILKHFEGFLSQVVALTFFIPLLIDTGGNSGAQASTTVIRAMAVGDVTPIDFLRVVWREARLGLILGLTMAAATLLRAFLLGSGVALGLTVAVTILAIVLVGSTVGAALPIIGRRLGFDPAVLSAPLITTIADTLGLLIYFWAARMILGL
ncbi:MAG: magnesium transporter [bacterium]|nr:magnesium transporter [bacterium]